MDAAKLAEFTGMYRKIRDNTTTEVRLSNGKLTMGAAELVPTGSATFEQGGRQVLFEGGRFRIVTPDDETVYERVDPARPSAADLAALAGTYTSPETGTPVTVAAKNGELTLAIGTNAPAPLRPTFRDAFMMQTTAIRFWRNANGNVTGLSAGDDRAWDLRFTKTAGETR